MRSILFLAAIGLFPFQLVAQDAPPQTALDAEQLQKKQQFESTAQLPGDTIIPPEQPQKREQMSLEALEALAAIIIADEEEDNYFTEEEQAIIRPSQYDSRVETRSLDPAIDWQKQVLNNAESVGIVVERSMISIVSDSFYLLDISATLGERFHLCPGAAFEHQPVIGVGTAFIIGEQQMITASHVFAEQPSEYAIIFGFELKRKDGTYEPLMRASNVYFPEKIIQQSVELDITSFEVGRPIDRPILKTGQSVDLTKGSGVYMIGHPSGLPQKVAFNASVQNNNHAEYFYTSLDAFQGNSGSPVFRLDTHELIGILVSGVADLKWTGNCYTNAVCRIPFCDGERVIRVERINED